VRTFENSIVQLQQIVSSKTEDAKNREDFLIQECNRERSFALSKIEQQSNRVKQSLNECLQERQNCLESLQKAKIALDILESEKQNAIAIAKSLENSLKFGGERLGNVEAELKAQLQIASSLVATKSRMESEMKQIKLSAERDIMKFQNDLSKSVNTLNSLKADSVNDIDNASKELSSARSKIVDLESRIQRSRGDLSEISSLNKQLTKAQNELEIADEESTKLRRENTDLISTSNKAVSAIKTQLELVVREGREATATILTYQATIKSLEKQAVASTQAQQLEKDELLSRLQITVSESNKRIAELRATQQQLHATINQISSSASITPVQTLTSSTRSMSQNSKLSVQFPIKPSKEPKAKAKLTVQFPVKATTTPAAKVSAKRQATLSVKFPVKRTNGKKRKGQLLNS